MKFSSPLLPSAALALVLAAGPGAAQDAAPVAEAEGTAAFSPVQEEAIGRIVRDYLVNNPSVLVEAIDALNAEREAEQAAARGGAIAALTESLESFPQEAILGNPQGDVTVVEFFDYNCGYCERAMADMDAVLAEDDEVAFILKEIPVLGPGSVGAARVSLAVREVAPASYGAFHRELLAVSGPVDEARALELAESRDLPMEEVRAALQSPAVGQTLAEVNEMANRLAIFGTPSYVVGDTVIEGAQGAETLRTAIANMRACGSAQCG